MTESIRTVQYEDYSCLIRFFEAEEVDRADKFERYPLAQIKNTLEDKKWDDKEIVYYEIGANVGMSVILAGKMLLDRGSVYAFEVEPTNYKRLIENIVINDLPNTVALPFGIGDKCALMPFFINERHLVDDQPRVGEGLHSFHTHEEMVGWHSPKHSFMACMFPLDHLIENLSLPLPTHLFIDAFGSEHEIIEGMIRAIERGGVDFLMVQIEAVGEYAEGENFDLADNKTYLRLISLGYELREATPLPGIEGFLRGYNCVFKRQR